MISFTINLEDKFYYDFNSINQPLLLPVWSNICIFKENDKYFIEFGVDDSRKKVKGELENFDEGLNENFNAIERYEIKNSIIQANEININNKNSYHFRVFKINMILNANQLLYQQME